MHHRYQRRAVRERLAQRLGRDDTGFVHWQEGSGPAAPGQRLQSVQHRFVLDGGGDEVPPAPPLEGLGHPADGEVVAFGASAREHNLGRVGADKGGDSAPGLV